MEQFLNANSKSVTIALSKGRVLDEVFPLLDRIGIGPVNRNDSDRSLVLNTNDANTKLLLVRASDVPTYVQQGAADLGIVGRDILNEHGSLGLYQPLDLQISRCRLMVAVKNEYDYESRIKRGARISVATKYVKVAREHFAKKGIHVDLIKLYGSMELAPLTGLADSIVDLVSTGNTLKANGLRPVELIMNISSMLIVNKASLKFKRELLRTRINQFRDLCQK